MKTHLFLIALIVMLPIAEAQATQTNSPNPGLFITTIIPQFVRSSQMDIAGRTRAGAEITVNINGADVRKATVTEDSFLFRGVVLNKVNNTLLLTAESQGEKVQQQYNIIVDGEPPRLNVSLPAVSLTASVVANISVSEPVNLTVTLEKKGVPATRPNGLRIDDISSSKVKLVWDAIPGIEEYGVYRNGTRIGVARTFQYEDFAIDGNSQYRYQVTAMGVTCVESERSDSVTAQTNSGTSHAGTVSEPKFTCQRSPQVILLNPGKTTINIQLEQGENFVTLTAKDRAGFTTVLQERVLYDTGAPKFIENNLPQLSNGNIYEDKITLKGKLSETGSVTAFVNGKAQKTVPTDSDGSFSFNINLERTINLNTKNIDSGLTGVNTPIDTGTQWANRVRLEAVDFAGLKAQVEGTISRALCGSGSKIEVHMTEPFPDMLNPRLMVEGLQHLGLAFNYTYRGGYSATILTRQINVKRLQLSPEFAKQYDNNLVSITTPQVRSQRVQKPTGEGYLQIQFGPLEDPWSQLVENDESGAESPLKPTMFDKEQRISDHRKGECKVPGFGCMKLFLELEIPFQEVTKKLNSDPLTRGTPETVKVENQVQRTCIQIEVPVDVRVNPKAIPSGLLKATSEVLGTIVENMDRVLGPLQTLGEVMFYTCAVGTVASAVPIFTEKWKCQYKNFIDTVGGTDGKFNEGVAAIGACEKAYGAGTKSLENCESCQSAKETRATVERVYRQVCDRVFCPAAPSLQYYIKTKGSTPLQEVKETNLPTNSFAGSDCAKWLQEKKGKASTTGTRRVPPRLFFIYNDIQDVYNKWLAHQDDDPEAKKSVNCAGLHPATAECCGYEYMQEWSSACGVSALGNTLDTFDEIKESTCLSAEKNNQNFITGKNPTDKIECNKLLNSASGFCEKDGGESTTTLEATEFCCEKSLTEYSGAITKYGLQGNREKKLYVLIIPQKNALTPTFGGIPRLDIASGEYDIKLGYIAETVEFERAPSNDHKSKITADSSLRHTVSSKLEGIEIESNIGEFFTTAKIDDYNKNPDSTTVRDTIKSFRNELCKVAEYDSTDATAMNKKCPLGSGTDDNGRAREIYGEVVGTIGSPDKEYIIRPADGLINSARCICLPTLIAYIKQWRNIMAAVRNCIDTILLTGDGEAGVCQAVVSQYACDLLYDAVACFTQKFSVGGAGTRGGFGPFGDVVGAMTATGTELSRSVESRYGDSSMYKSIFVDRKLVHSICLFAFTGTWNFDLGAVFDKAVDDIPIESQALMTPCSRRFDSFNPATQPKGLVTWIYHFGVGFAAGADAQLELHLQCSGGFKCKEIDGFARGKCDCDTPKDIMIEPEGFQTQVRKGEIPSMELFHRMEGAPGDNQIRWDSAYLLYRWNDGKQFREKKTTPCSISQVGGAGAVPSFCRYDPSTFSFRCQLGDVYSGISFLKTAVGAPHKIPEEVFAIGENVNVSLDVKQEYPAPTNFKNNKFLEYTIRNQNGIEVEHNLRLPALSRDGDYTVSSLNVFGVGNAPAVKKSWFEQGTETLLKTYRAKTWTSSNPQTIAGGDGGVINDVTLSKTPLPNKKFILELEQAGSGEKWTLYDTDLSAGFTLDTGSTGTINGLSGKRSTYLDATGIISESKITYTSAGKPGYVDPDKPVLTQSTSPMLHDTLTITLSGSRIGLQPGEKRQILIETKPPTVVNPCADTTGPLKPQRFTLTYTAYDANQFGEVTDQISVDPNTENLVQISQPFFAVCAPLTSEDDRLAKQAATAGISDLFARLTTFKSVFDPLGEGLKLTTLVFNQGIFNLDDFANWDSSKKIQARDFIREQAARYEEYGKRFEAALQTLGLSVDDEQRMKAGAFAGSAQKVLQTSLNEYRGLIVFANNAEEALDKGDPKTKEKVQAYVGLSKTASDHFEAQEKAIERVLADIANKKTSPPDGAPTTPAPASPPTSTTQTPTTHATEQPESFGVDEIALATPPPVWNENWLAVKGSPLNILNVNSEKNQYAFRPSGDTIWRVYEYIDGSSAPPDTYQTIINNNEYQLLGIDFGTDRTVHGINTIRYITGKPGLIKTYSKDGVFMEGLSYENNIGTKIGLNNAISAAMWNVRDSAARATAKP